MEIERIHTNSALNKTVYFNNEKYYGWNNSMFDVCVEGKIEKQSDGSYLFTPHEENEIPELTIAIYPSAIDYVVFKPDFLTAKNKGL